MADEDGAPLDLDGDAFRALGHRVVDRLADTLDRLRALPVAPDATAAEIGAALGDAPLAEDGVAPEALLEEAIALLVRYNRLTGHPRQWGYIIGAAAPLGALGDLIAATLNPNVVSWSSAPMATAIECQVVDWLGGFLGYPADGGLMVSGGNVANITGFLAARRAKAGEDVRRHGVRPGLVAYVSRETHTWVEKAADIAGLGTDAVRWVETDGDGRLDLAALAREVAADRAAGRQPFLVVGNAGTVSTGAVDPLPALARFARAHGLWFHVDGAYGAPAVAAAGTPPELAGLGLADSLAVDAHKWLHAPLEAGCVLVRRRRDLVDTFAYHPPYYAGHAAAGDAAVNFHEMGIQNSRAFRALKVWLILRQAGRSGLVRLIERDLAHAAALHEALAAAPDIEALTRGLSIVTFRYAPPGLTADRVDALNRALVGRLQKGGEVYVSNAIVGGRFALRACITNFRTRDDDIARLPAVVVREGRALAAEE